VNAAARNVTSVRWVAFALAGQRYALPLETVSHIVRAAAVTPLPLAPDSVAGALDLGGRVVPVYDLRRRFGLPERPLGLDDHFVIARTSERYVALIVDQPLGLIEAQAMSDGGALAPHLRHLLGVLSLPDGLVLIHDLESFLSLEEEAALRRAMRAAEESCTPTP
jgi:purine-binding chemotaxis protein CheW